MSEKTGDKTKKADAVLGDAMEKVVAAVLELMNEETKKEGRNIAGQNGIQPQCVPNIVFINCNVQVGNSNTIIQGAEQAQEKESLLSSEEEEREDEKKCNQEKRPEEMTPKERKIYETLKSTNRATLHDVEVALNNVGKDYRRFLRNLGLTDVDIDHLELDYKAEGVKEVLHQGLMKWTKSEHQTVGQLAQSLKKLGKKDTVEELCDNISAGLVNM